MVTVIQFSKHIKTIVHFKWVSLWHVKYTSMNNKQAKTPQTATKCCCDLEHKLTIVSNVENGHIYKPGNFSSGFVPYGKSPTNTQRSNHKEDVYCNILCKRGKTGKNLNVHQ